MPMSPERPDAGRESADYVVGRHKESPIEGVSLFGKFQDVIRKNKADNEALPEADQDIKYLPKINPEMLEPEDMMVHDKMLSSGAGELSEKQFAEYHESVQKWVMEESAKGPLADREKIISRVAFMGRMTGLWEEEVKRRKEEEVRNK